MTFDVAYALSLNGTLFDLSEGLELQIWGQCNSSIDFVAYSSYGFALQTAAPTNNASWVPGNGSDWHEESFVISAPDLIGQSVTLEFVATTNLGNIFLDNVIAMPATSSGAVSLTTLDVCSLFSFVCFWF